MARVLLLFGALILGLSLLSSSDFVLLDAIPLRGEDLMWVALLPGVYIVGIFLLKD